MQQLLETDSLLKHEVGTHNFKIDYDTEQMWLLFEVRQVNTYVFYSVIQVRIMQWV